jgi:hypothetical protein
MESSLSKMRLTAPPEERITYSDLPRTNAIERPSGDHAGCPARLSQGGVMSLNPVPFSRITYSLPARSNTSRDPSGDQDGDLSR